MSVWKNKTEPRASGRTFRFVLQSLVSASMGRRVLMVLPNAEEAKDAWSMAADACGPQIWSSKAFQEIQFPNGGMIRFISASVEPTKWPENVTVIVDHGAVIKGGLSGTSGDVLLSDEMP